jgi:hypothetical protein
MFLYICQNMAHNLLLLFTEHLFSLLLGARHRALPLFLAQNHAGRALDKARLNLSVIFDG